MKRRAKIEKSGRLAEALAAMYLTLLGYKILSRRFKCAQGEVDIIAKRGHVLAIIEVKKRKTLSEAEESLTPTNRRRVSQAADAFIARNRSVQNLAVRFDALLFYRGWKIKHLKDAWRDF